jgi:hypothetical protein
MKPRSIGPHIVAAAGWLAATMNVVRIVKDRSHLAPLTPTVLV